MKTLFILCLLFLRVMTTSWISFITLFIVPFFWSLFIWQDFTISQFSTSLFCLWAFIPLYAFITSHVWLHLIRVWCLTCWGWPKNVMLVDVLSIKKSLFLSGIIDFNPCLMCDLLAVIYECFAYAYMFYLSVWPKSGHCCIPYFLLSKTLFMLVYLKYDYT